MFVAFFYFFFFLSFYLMLTFLLPVEWLSTCKAVKSTHRAWNILLENILEMCLLTIYTGTCSVQYNQNNQKNGVGKCINEKRLAMTGSTVKGRYMGTLFVITYAWNFSIKAYFTNIPVKFYHSNISDVHASFLSLRLS